MRRELKEYPDLVLRPEDFRGPLDFTQIFGRAGPVHVEVGSGKGAFLIHQAQAQPEANFLGIEWARKYFRFAVDRLGRWGLTNVRLVRADAPVFLRDFVPEGSVDCFHIYFPDPWPKKRHHRRRFLQAPNVETLIRCLKPGGEIRLATDHADYHEQMRQVTSAYADRLEEIEFPRPAGAREGELTGTNYERKYVKEDRPIYTLALRKRAPTEGADSRPDVRNV
jgi:tRNA (guanine-N7-)-methyltransferase